MEGGGWRGSGLGSARPKEGPQVVSWVSRVFGSDEANGAGSILSWHVRLLQYY